MVRTFELTQTARIVPNSFDYIGLVLGLPRLPDEHNASYRKRLNDVFVNRANSSESGLTNGISRELGFNQFDALTITYNGDASNSPRVIVRDVQLELYSNWDLLDESVSPIEADGDPIDIYTRGGDAYYLPGLIEQINASTNFTAAIANGVSEKTLSACIINTDSYKIQASEELKPFFTNHLEHTDIIPGSLVILGNNRKAFVTQKATVEELAVTGDYYVDYDNGSITSYSVPASGTVCRYMHNELPLVLRASPVILHELGSSYFRSKIFEQVIQPDGTYENGLPKDDAIDYINELLSAKAMLWGQ